MKKLLLVNCSLFIFHCSLSLATCPPGYTEIDVGALYAFHPTSCPSGYSEINTPVVLPVPAGDNSDAKGTFIYEVCSYQ